MIRVLHIIQQLGPGRGGVRTFVSTMLDCPAPDIEQSVLSVGRVEGDRFGERFFGPLIDSYSPLLVGTLGAKRLDAFLSKHRFDIVQIHTNNALGFVFASEAKKAGVPARIVHCHNSALGSASRLKNMVNVAMIDRFLPAASERWACSEVAGGYLFQGADYALVHNGVDTEKFRFSSSDRAAVRHRLGIPGDAAVIGFVGAGIPAKNTLRALDIFNQLRSRDTDDRLLLFGQAEELPLAKEKAAKLGLGESAVFIGTVDDIWRYYSAMDALLAPSFHEGLPIAFIEAQANGLPILSSDAVTQEADLTGLLQRAGLSLSDKEWADLLEACAGKREITAKVDYVPFLDKAGYTTRSLYKQLSDRYRNMTKGA